MSALIKPMALFQYYCQDTMTDSYFSGETYMASTGQSNSHASQHMQSSGYLIMAFVPSSSILITSIGQLHRHSPQPMHNSLSIFSIVIVITSLAAMHVTTAFTTSNLFKLRPSKPVWIISARKIFPIVQTSAFRSKGRSP